MASVHAHERRKRHGETRNVRFNRHSVRKSIFGEIDKTKEYTICWLWENTASQHDWYETSKDKLRGIVDYLQKISDINAIRKAHVQNIFLVISGRSLRAHCAELATFNQIRSIYVYETNGKDKSVGENSKVLGPFNDLDELFITLSKNVRTMTGQISMASELPPLTSASKTVERSTSTTYSYVTDWYINLVHALEEVPPARTCKEKFIEECSILYQHNPSVLQAIKEFSNTYIAEDAIRWYTRDGFLYKVLNKVLREKNQQTIQFLHFLIYDLHEQLRNELKRTKQDWIQATDTVRLYRGQLMSMQELQQLRKNKGEELFINSFLSMTTDLAVANMFSGAGAFGPDDPMQSVIFHIEWADSNPKQGVADIHHLSFNGDEGEILLCPTFTVNLLDCVYDEKERVWNASFTHLMPMEDPLIRISDDERLMRLELTLRHLIEEKDSSDDDDDEETSDTFSDSPNDKFEFASKFCSTFVEDVPILQRELILPEFCSVTLNSDNSDRFELKTIRSFTPDSLDHGPKIDDEMVITLYDVLGGVFKTKGKLMQAYFYYQKASIYDKPQSQTTYTRQAHLAQIHKLNGDYELAWNIFDELMKRTDDVDNFLYEDIAFARTVDISDQEFLQNSRAFLEYCSTYDIVDDDDDASELFVDERVSDVIDAWAELGYKYFYQMHDTKQALECYTREKALSSATGESQSCCFHPLLGSCSERMGDVYASENNMEKALTLYQEALDISMQATFINNLVTAGRCLCKIGHYSANHEPDIFHRAFQSLICGYGKPYTRDSIGKCYVHLARSLQRCQRYEQALKYAKQALSIFLPDPLLLERLIDECCQLIIELHQTGDNIPTKEQLLNDRTSLDDEQIKATLQTTLKELEQTDISV